MGFQEARDKLSTYPVLRAPDWYKPFDVYCDVSNIAVVNPRVRMIKTNPLPMQVSI